MDCKIYGGFYIDLSFFLFFKRLNITIITFKLENAAFVILFLLLLILKKKI